MKLRFEICERNLTNNFKLRQKVLLQEKFSMNGISEEKWKTNWQLWFNNTCKSTTSTNTFFLK